MKILILLSLTVGFNAAFGQKVIDVDNAPDRVPTSPFSRLSENLLNSTKYIRIVSGSPYFSEAWMKGTVYITDSTVVRNVLLRLDLLDGSLLYMNDKNIEVIVTTPAIQVVLLDSITNKKYIFIPSSGIPGASDKTWYQVLAGKKLTLLKEFHKQIFESKPYGSSITEREIRTFERYFIGVNNFITRVKKFSDIIELAGNKGSKLQEYIDKNKLSFKKEADVISLVNYYHTLD